VFRGEERVIDQRSRVRIVPAFAACLLFSALCTCDPVALGQDLRNPEFMTKAHLGFEQIYNLDYRQARATFGHLQTTFPDHPAPPLYLASVVWLEELFERNELDLDKFIAPAHFTQPTQKRMSHEDRKYFEDQMQASLRASEAILKKNPKHPDARYFLGAVYGVQGAFAITIDRSYSDAFAHGKRAYKYHHDLVQENPDYFDAYMTVGLYEYVVDNLPWYIKWVAVIVGYRGSEERGFDYLNRAAQKGLYARDDAQVLQMVLFMRESRPADALTNARKLHEKYPKNYILHLNRAQILEKMGKNREAGATYREVVERAEAQEPNYSKISLASLRVGVARKLLELSQFNPALEQYQTILKQSTLPERDRAWAHLGAGQALDAMGKREEAVGHYGKVLKLRDYDGSHSKARRYLARAYPATG
jgi:tetratricopeptide (TPR) repeat protein